MKKSKLSPDPVRDPPKNQGEYQAPGSHLVLPARAYGDNRFNRYPMTLRCFVICCGHASSWTGIFFPNQTYIARVLQCSQQAVSQHMLRLLKWNYIERLRPADKRRKYGKRGALWRVIYDVTKSLEDVIAMQPAQDRDPEFEKEIAQETLKQQGPRKHKYKSQLVQGPACKDKEQGKKNKVQLVQSHKAQLVHNNINITSKKYKGKIEDYTCRNICNIYNQILHECYGKAWNYDMKQLHYAADLIRLGYTAETFKKDATGVVKWKRDKNQQPPFSLQYFIKRKQSQGQAQENKTAMDIVRHAANKMKVK